MKKETYSHLVTAVAGAGSVVISTVFVRLVTDTLLYAFSMERILSDNDNKKIYAAFKSFVNDQLTYSRDLWSSVFTRYLSSQMVYIVTINRHYATIYHCIYVHRHVK